MQGGGCASGCVLNVTDKSIGWRGFDPPGECALVQGAPLLLLYLEVPLRGRGEFLRPLVAAPYVLTAGGLPRPLWPSHPQICGLIEYPDRRKLRRKSLRLFGMRS